MRYTWENPDSLIREVEIYPFGKRREAVIYAPAGAEPEKLRALAAGLHQRGLVAIPDVQDERYVLRVEQLAAPDSLLTALKSAGAVSGELRVEATDRDKKPHVSFAGKVKETILPASMYAYLLADAMMITAGLVRNRGLLPGEARKGGNSELATGLLWTIPNLAVAACIKQDPEMQTGMLLKHVKEYLDHQGVEIPKEEEFTIDHLARKDGVVARVVDFFYAHPTEINSTFEALGGLTLMRAGYQQRIKIDGQERSNRYKTAAGALVFAGQGGSVLLQEKKKQLWQQAADAKQLTAAHRDHPEQAEEGEKTQPQHRNVFQRGMDWFTEKPLRLAGTFSFGNNILHIIGASQFERPRVAQFLAGYDEAHDKLQTRLNEARRGESQEYWQTQLTDLKNEHIKAKNYDLAAKWNLATAITFMFANAMYAMSSRDASLDLKALGGLEQVYAVTARIIAAQPQEHHGDLINRLAGFLSTQPDVTDTTRQAALKLTAKVRALAMSPWTERVAVPPPGADAVPRPAL